MLPVKFLAEGPARLKRPMSDVRFQGSHALIFQTVKPGTGERASLSNSESDGTGNRSEGVRTCVPSGSKGWKRRKLSLEKFMFRLFLGEGTASLELAVKPQLFMPSGTETTWFNEKSTRSGCQSSSSLNPGPSGPWRDCVPCGNRTQKRARCLNRRFLTRSQNRQNVINNFISKAILKEIWKSSNETRAPWRKSRRTQVQVGR